MALNKRRVIYTPYAEEDVQQIASYLNFEYGIKAVEKIY